MTRKKRRAKPKAKKSATKRRTKRRIRLMVVPESEAKSRSIIKYTGEGTVAMHGPGNVVMECGNCGVPLVEGVPVSAIQGVVFICPNCGEFNATMA